MQGFVEHLIGFPNEFNKFNNTGAQMQDSIYHMTLKSHFNANFAPNITTLPLKKRCFYGHQHIMLRRNDIICICNPLVDYRF